MRYFILLTAIFFAFQSAAQEWEDHRSFAGASPTRTVKILSSTDTSFFKPIIDSFIQSNPKTTVEYFVTGTADIDRIFRKSPQEYDLVISSAMDLQIKLVNDGYAHKTDIPEQPSWAQWRQSLFAFTMEPAAIVVNKAAFEGQEIPQTRQDLIQALRARPNVFRNKIGTYDVRQSGLGYLFATQDARASETYWRLMEVMGGLGTKLYCCSGDMIDDLLSGEIAVAYNVLGSYAQARNDEDDRIEIILPADFPTTMMRTALISKTTTNVVDAEKFIQYLLDVQSNTSGSSLQTLPTFASQQSQKTISLEPALMTYLDRLKRQTFIGEWERAVIQ